MFGYCYDCEDEVELYDDGELWCCEMCEGANVDENDEDDEYIDADW